MSAIDYEPRICAIDAEYAIFDGNRLAMTYKAAIMKRVQEIKRTSMVGELHQLLVPQVSVGGIEGEQEGEDGDDDNNDAREQNESDDRKLERDKSKISLTNGFDMSSLKEGKDGSEELTKSDEMSLGPYKRCESPFVPFGASSPPTTLDAEKEGSSSLDSPLLASPDETVNHVWTEFAERPALGLDAIMSLDTRKLNHERVTDDAVDCSDGIVANGTLSCAAKKSVQISDTLDVAYFDKNHVRSVGDVPLPAVKRIEKINIATYREQKRQASADPVSILELLVSLIIHFSVTYDLEGHFNHSI